MSKPKKSYSLPTRNGGKCLWCGTDKGVALRQDPFTNEVNDEIWYVEMCDPCANKRAEDA